MAIIKIDKFTKLIVNNLFPALQESLGIKMYASPVTSSSTIVTYTGDLGNDRVKLEFSSNHVELASYQKENAVFLTIYYRARGTKAGILNLDNIDECVELIYAALYELGYRSEEDLEKERQEKEEKEKLELEKKRAEEDRLKQAKRAEQIADEEKERLAKEQRDKEPSLTPEEETEQSIKEAESDFDKYLFKLKQINTQNSQIIASISFETNNNNYRVVSVDMFYITADLCLVQTTGINPKIDKTARWDKAKEYIMKVTRAVNGVISLGAVDENNEDIDISDLEDDSNNVNVDFDI